MENKKEPLSQITLERYALQELPLEEMKKIAILLEQDKALFAKYEEISKSNADVILNYPADKIAREIKLRAHTQNVLESLKRGSRNSRKRILKPMFAVAFGLGVLGICLFPTLHVNNKSYTETEDITRMKGLASILTVYRNSNGKAERLENLARVRNGDVIQLGYIAANRKYGVIFSIDGNGGMTLHFPETRSGKTLLEPKGEALLKNAYELDDAPYFEHFFLVTSDSPVSIDTVLSAGKDIITRPEFVSEKALLHLPSGLSQASFVLIKETK